MPKTLLHIKNLTLAINGKAILQNINLELELGQRLALVGESGSGKTMLGSAILGLLPPQSLLGGQISYKNKPLTQQDKSALRGKEIAYIPQNPFTALNPVKNIGDHLLETIEVLCPSLQQPARKELANDLLTKVQLKGWQTMKDLYPFELSGGMAQRVMVALALVASPKLLIADEPTTALDPETQAEILALIEGLVNKAEMTLIFITHDLAIVKDLCERVCVMKTGLVVEEGVTSQIFQAPREVYTQELLAAAFYL